VSQAPFDDPRVRRAFAHAIDKETLADVVLGGYYFPATGGFVPPGMPGYSAGIGLPYDPERARGLLADAGYPGGRGFAVVEMLTSGFWPAYHEYLVAQWREVLGVEITWETTTGWSMFRDRLNRKPPHIFIGSWTTHYPDPDSFLRIWQSQSYTRWRNETYNQLVEEARRVTDQRERMNLYGQADRLLVEEAVIVPLIYARLHLLVKPWVSKLPISAMRWWFWKDVIIEPH